MTSRKLLAIAASLLTLLISLKPSSAAQNTQLGTIQGTVFREGTTDPIPDVQITVLAKGSLAATGFNAQQILQAFNRGAAVSPELVQIARDATQGGPGAAIANVAPLTTVSDSAGRFTVRNVSAGEHIVRAQLQNYFGPVVNGTRPPGASETVVVAGQPTEVRLSLVKGGTISGRVLDPSGKPRLNAPVEALQSAYDDGTPSLEVLNGKNSDDRGEFRLGVLPPGEYYVAVSPVTAGPRGAAPPAALPPGEVAVTTLYPNAIDPAKALPIVLHEGEDLTGINIQMRSLPGAKISGRVTNTLPPGPAPGGRGGTRPLIAVVGLAPREKAALPPDTIGGGAGITASTEDGTFEIPNVPPGIYDLFARLPIASGWGGLAPPERATTPLAFGKTSVEVRGGNVEGVTVLVHQGVDVKGRVTVDGQPPAAAKVRISFFPDDSATRVNETQIFNVYGQIAVYPPFVAPDGSFAIPVVPEGYYRFQVAIAGPGSSYVADVRQGAVSVYDNGLTVGNEPVNPIEVTINTDGGTIEGNVVSVDRKPVPRTTVVLVPSLSRRQNPELYKIVQTDAQGHFALTGVAPGSWKVFAWESIQPSAYQNAEFIQKYEERGTSVTVAAGVRVNTDVPWIRK
jgi:hypothetical protein